MMWRLVLAVLVAGFVLNLTGCAGNVLPAGISIATTALALATFVCVAPLLPWLLSGRAETRA